MFRRGHKNRKRHLEYRFVSSVPKSRSRMFRMAPDFVDQLHGQQSFGRKSVQLPLPKTDFSSCRKRSWSDLVEECNCIERWHDVEHHLAIELDVVGLNRGLS